MFRFVVCSPSVFYDLDEFDPVSGVGVDRQHIANARRVKLVFKEVRFQRGRFLRSQAVAERARPNRNGFVDTECFRKVLGIAERELLPVEVADGRMGFHDNARLVAVDARDERAVDGSDQTERLRRDD